MIIPAIVGFIFGVLAVVVFNHFFPAKVDKASKELLEEVNKK